MASAADCANLPKELQKGCEWRFGDFFQGAYSPDMEYEAVRCPKALTTITGCKQAPRLVCLIYRSDDLDCFGRAGRFPCTPRMITVLCSTNVPLVAPYGIFSHWSC